MAEERIQGKTKGRLRRNASAASSTLAPNLLDRKFAPGAGPTAWVGDITYVPTRQGWLHLAVVISVQTRQVLGYSTSDRMTEDLVVKGFANAWALHPQRPGLIFHSDRGGQYWGNGFRQLPQSQFIRQEMDTASKSFSGRELEVGVGRPTNLGGKTLDEHRRETLAKLQRWMAAIDAVDAVVAAAYDELSASSGDVGDYQAASQHLKQTVADWGLSQ